MRLHYVNSDFNLFFLLPRLGSKIYGNPPTLNHLSPHQSYCKWWMLRPRVERRDQESSEEGNLFSWASLPEGNAWQWSILGPDSTDVAPFSDRLMNRDHIWHKWCAHFLASRHTDTIINLWAYRVMGKKYSARSKLFFISLN